jgi:hypothetical protein
MLSNVQFGTEQWERHAELVEVWRGCTAESLGELRLDYCFALRRSLSRVCFDRLSMTAEGLRVTLCSAETISEKIQNSFLDLPSPVHALLHILIG